MRRITRLAVWLAPILLLVLAFVGLGQGIRLAAAQSGGGYDLTWNTVDGGGASFSTGGGYTLGGTIGQSDAGVQGGGSYSLAGGFWVSVGDYKVYLPFLRR